MPDACPVQDPNICLYKDVCYSPIIGYKDSAGKCNNCPENCSTCVLNATTNKVECTDCKEGYCMDTERKICTLPQFTNQVLQLKDLGGVYKFQCVGTCDEGFSLSEYAICFK